MSLVAVPDGMMEGMVVVSWVGSGYLQVCEEGRDEGWWGGWDEESREVIGIPNDDRDEVWRVTVDGTKLIVTVSVIAIMIFGSWSSS